jgi:hypothetical protein
MTRARWGVLAVLVAVLAGVQTLGLDRHAETKEEDKLRKLGDLPVGDMVPTYIASLFFGPFRAAAIDVLWMQLRRAEEERRWYEFKEILEMISYFQPRNPEVWVNLGWQAAYNVANGFTDPEKRWYWVRYGLTWLRRGTRMLPDHPQITAELAYTLHHKPSWRDSILELPLLARIEQDAALQVELRRDGTPNPGRPLSAFELALPWLERARETLLRTEEGSTRTQMGLLLYPSTMDGYVRRCLCLQAIYDWRRGRIAEAAAGFRAAEAHSRRMLSPGRYREPVSEIFRDWADYYARMPAIVEAVERAKSGRLEDEREAIRLMQDVILPQVYPLDEGLLWSRYDPDGLLNALKRKAAGGKDELEVNDSPHTAADVAPGENVDANLAPEGLDTDWYWMHVIPPKGADPATAPPRPIPMQLDFFRPEGSAAELKVTVLTPDRKPVLTTDVAGRAKIPVDATRYGAWFVKVEPRDPKAPWPKDSRYSFQYGPRE